MAGLAAEGPCQDELLTLAAKPPGPASGPGASVHTHCSDGAVLASSARPRWAPTGGRDSLQVSGPTAAGGARPKTGACWRAKGGLGRSTSILLCSTARAAVTNSVAILTHPGSWLHDPSSFCVH